jgi:hypothetical protein
MQAHGGLIPFYTPPSSVHSIAHSIGTTDLVAHIPAYHCDHMLHAINSPISPPYSQYRTPGFPASSLLPALDTSRFNSASAQRHAVDPRAPRGA